MGEDPRGWGEDMKQRRGQWGKKEEGPSKEGGPEGAEGGSRGTEGPGCPHLHQVVLRGGV